MAGWLITPRGGGRGGLAGWSGRSLGSQAEGGWMGTAMGFGEATSTGESSLTRQKVCCKTTEVRRRSVVACGGGGPIDSASQGSRCC